MVRAQREMSLYGYDVYRFGGYEFMGADSDENLKNQVLENLKSFFFATILQVWSFAINLIPSNLVQVGWYL